MKMHLHHVNFVLVFVFEQIQPSDGYVLIAKDNVGKSGIKTYVYDIASSWL